MVDAPVGIVYRATITADSYDRLTLFPKPRWTRIDPATVSASIMTSLREEVAMTAAFRYPDGSSGQPADPEGLIRAGYKTEFAPGVPFQAPDGYYWSYHMEVAVVNDGGSFDYEDEIIHTDWPCPKGHVLYAAAIQHT